MFWGAGLALAAFSAMHWFITYEHWRHVGPQRESVLVPGFVAVISAGLAIWLIRRAITCDRSA